jgi:tRNA threonylcarbamoyladenosine biosynthesis protein TsaB
LPYTLHVLLLAIDTSSPSGSVAVLQKDKVLGSVSTSTSEDYSSRMFRHVEWLLKELQLDLSRFDAFAVAAGPGSFTGLRVGLAAVKAWAEVTNKPIVPVNVLGAMAMQSRSSSTLLAPVFDARRNEVYFGFYPQRPELSEYATPGAEGDAQVGPPDEFLKAVEARAGEQEVTIVTTTPEIIENRLKEWNEKREEPLHVSLETVANVLAPVIGRIGWERAQAGQIVNALTLDANYVRRTDAELKWKAPVTKF